MTEYIIHQSIVYDSLPADGRTTFNFLKDDFEASDEKGIKINEKEICEWFIKQSGARSILYSEIFIPNHYKTGFEVKKPIIEHEHKSPDIDLMFYHQGVPHLTIALQVKMIKIKNSNQEEIISKLQKLQQGVIQANLTREMGFYKTYLMIIIINDGSEKTFNNQIFRLMNIETRKKIYRYAGLENLNENVGLVFCEITKASKKPLFMNGTINLRAEFHAKPQEQSASLTNRIKEYMYSH